MAGFPQGELSSRFMVPPLMVPSTSPLSRALLTYRLPVRVGGEIGAPETGVPGLLPMCLGEFIMGGPVTGEDMGKEVAGLPGLGLAMAPGGIPRGPPGPW